ncbi:unnamed protein product [Paramecium pentaurelia]|uniref:Tetratricopeptide repeat protein n=1 Tax=Paramecium pentaurelia TaxID=43138 RepID=A0A8S1Y8C5_9CILI|nr:unnamed protein product [Paramecium pentaurelia]
MQKTQEKILDENNTCTYQFCESKAKALEKQEKWQEAVQCWDEGIAKLKRAPFFQAKKQKHYKIQENGKKLLNVGIKKSIKTRIIEFFMFGKVILKQPNSIGFKDQSLSQNIFFKGLLNKRQIVFNQTTISIFFCYLVCQNMMQEAIDCWNQGILNNPNDRGYYEEKAMALLNQRRNLEVIKCSDEVNAIFQESEAINFIRIYALLKCKGVITFQKLQNEFLLDNLKLLKKAIIARRLAKQDTTFQKSQL